MADLKNNRIQVFDNQGKFLRKWGETGSGNGQFKAPAGIGVDKFDNIYVTEIGNDQLQVFDSSGKFITSLASGAIGWVNSPISTAVLWIRNPAGFT